MQVDLSGEVALVTGGTKNIGREISRQLAASSVTVACCFSSDETAAASTVDEITKAGGRAGAYQVDLENTDDIRRLVAQVKEDFGDVSILVNNAALRPRQRIADIEQLDWDQVHAVNLRAPFFLSQAVLPGMRERGWGRIVNISGIDAYIGDNQRPHVTASKLGVVGLMRGLALETATWGVTVNAVVPGYIDTVRDHPEWYPEMDKTAQERLDRIPLARVGTTKEVAAAVLFLCSKEAAYITGQDLMVSGGYSPLTRQPWYEY